MPMSFEPPTEAQTKFEQDLLVYFPDLAKWWHLLAFDPFYELVMTGVFEMVDTNGYGSLEIIYSNGKITYVNLKKQLTAHHSRKPEKIRARQALDDLV
jgi:hypothetical protein